MMWMGSRPLPQIVREEIKQKMKSNKLILAASAVLVVIVVFILVTRQQADLAVSQQASIETPQNTQAQKPPTAALAEATYVGRQQCDACHQQQVMEWQGSHHDLAMQLPTEETVLGDFNNTTFTYHDVSSSFYKKDGKYFVNTDNAAGEMQEFEIKYTFGVTPLQQYLIEFPGGRLQVLNVAWNSTSEEEGGQRWFHLYPNENVDHTDPFHWTGVYQNWNNMCAECHSTNLKKNYDYEKDAYDTTWSEIDVSCEACHGPASNHVELAQTLKNEDEWQYIENKGLVVNLGDPRQGKWKLSAGRSHALRSVAFDTSMQLQTCARCHARRAVFGDSDYRHGRPFMNTHLPALLAEELYYSDGQIKDEVYVYGSFLQSKMHKEGVACSDCHNPHSLQLKEQGNALCAQCHNASQFDAQSHHHHEETGSGALCINCHMPQTKYMVVDPRADHSMRVPRPDLSDELGAPNACTMCHVEETNTWAANAISQWGVESGSEHYGQVIQAARNGQAQTDKALSEIVLDQNQPGIVRATALSLLRDYAYIDVGELLDQAYQDRDPLVRNAVAEYLEVLAPGMRIKHGAVLLEDSVRAVRMSAARALVEVPAESLTPAQQQAIQRGLDEYIKAQEYSSDRPEGRVNLGTLYISLNKPDKAEAYLKAAIENGSALAQGYVNLADLYRLQQRDEEGEQILRLGLEQSENPAPIHHALGLVLVRQRNVEGALIELQQAADLAPGVARYAYVYGIALQSVKGYAEAINYLDKASQQHPSDLNILTALASYSYEKGDDDAAKQYAEKLLILAPQHQGAREIIGLIESR